MDAPHLQAPRSGAPLSEKPAKGHRTDRIEGSFRAITVHQLTLAWWLHADGHMTRRQLRVYFALHELAERRRYMERDGRPLYTLEEIIALVGGRGEGAKARSETARDLLVLRTLGLADFTAHSITFARSADQIRLTTPENSGGVDDLAGFWSMLQQIPNTRRTVPVPRRIVRALAAGFSKATTALIIAVLIRGLFWHKQDGTYRTDGRYKLSWVAEVFGVSRRRLSEARASLIGIGWLEELEVGHWQKNQWGLHDRINTDWKPPAVGEGSRQEAGQPSAGTSTPNRDFSAGTSSPDLTGSLPLTGNLNTRNPAPMRAGPSGVSTSSTLGGRRKRSGGQGRRVSKPGGPPNLRDIRAEDFASTERMLELHEQACALGLSTRSEHGRIEFLSFAERARHRGRRAGALLFWLLRERKSAFITQHDEDEASIRLRQHINGPNPRFEAREVEPEPPAAEAGGFTDEDRFVAACLRVAQQRQIDDPFIVARQAKDWTREQWDTAHWAFNQSQWDRWGPSGGSDEV